MTGLGFRVFRCILRVVMEICAILHRSLHLVMAQAAMMREFWNFILARVVAWTATCADGRACVLFRVARDRMAQCIAILSFPRNRESKVAGSRTSGGIEPPDSFCGSFAAKVIAAVVAVVSAGGIAHAADDVNNYYLGKHSADLLACQALVFTRERSDGEG